MIQLQVIKNNITYCHLAPLLIFSAAAIARCFFTEHGAELRPVGHPLGTAQPQSAQGTVWAAFSFCDYFAELAVLTFFFLKRISVLLVSYILSCLFIPLCGLLWFLSDEYLAYLAHVRALGLHFPLQTASKQCAPT